MKIDVVQLILIIAASYISGYVLGCWRVRTVTDVRMVYEKRLKAYEKGIIYGIKSTFKYYLKTEEPTNLDEWFEDNKLQ